NGRTDAAGPGGWSGELWGALAAMLVALPSSIAFGVLVYSAVGPGYAGTGALAGIVGAAVLGVVAPLVGRNGGFITAPCAPAAAVLAGLAAGFVEGGDMPPERIFGLLALTALVAALLQVLFGLVRAGRLIKFIPYQVVSGYLSGVALVIAVAQLPKLLGLPADMPLGRGLLAPEAWNWTGIAVGAITMVAMAVAPALTQKVPAAIIGLAAGIAAYFALGWLNPALLVLEGNRLVIGPIGASGSLLGAAGERAASISSIGIADVMLISGSALTLAVLLSIDTLKTGVVLDALTRRRHNSNRELLAQGSANLAAFFAGGMPGAGTMGATLVNVTSGGRTPWSGVMEGVFVLAAFLLLGELIAWVPIGALAGLLLMVAWRMFDRGMFHLLKRPGTRVDFAVIATVVAVAQVGLILASAVGVALAIMLFIRDQIRGSVIASLVHLDRTHAKRKRLLAEREILAAHGQQAAVVQLQGNLFFGTTDQMFSELEKELGTLRFLLLDLRRVHSMDYTAGHLLEQMRDRLRERGGELLFSGMPSSLPSHQDIERYLGELGLASGAGVRIFDTRDGAIEWMEDRILEAEGWEPPSAEELLDLAGIELFADLDPVSLGDLATAVQPRSIPAGGRVFSRDETGDELFLIRRGRVHVLLPLAGGKHHHLATLCQGDYFGEMAFLDHEPRSADVVAATAVDLYALSRDRFDALARGNPVLGSKVFEWIAYAISQRLRAADAEVQALETR
ncbi:MAG: SLC26A/SulP transporter family protein, partial [Burkholderiales bacterium]